MSNPVLNFDADGDGINDSYLSQIDLDGDGINETEILFADSNGDGIFDTQIQYADINGDGIIENIISTDTTGDGIADVITVGIDSDNNGYYDASVTSLYNNGILLAQETAVDINNDGIYDIVETDWDTNRDGIIDTVIFNTDSNNDGIFDAVNVYQDINGDNVLELVPVDYNNNPDTTIPAEYDTMLNFDPENSNPEAVVGEPAADMEHWEYQGMTNRCALFAQKTAIEELTGQDINIENFADIAEENGWFTEEGGTNPDDLNKMLQYYGIESEMTTGASLEDIEKCLSEGGKVIVAVDGDEIWDADHDSNFYAPNDPNHAIEIIGVDYSDLDNPMVIINDSGTPDGCGEMVPVDQFMDAWEDSDYQIVTASI